MKTQSLIAVAALCVGAAGGYLIGKSGSDEEAASEVAARDTKSGRPGSGGGGSAAKPSRIRSTDEIYRLPGQMNRVQSLLDYYSGLDPSQFEFEAGKLESLPPQQRILAAFLLFSRWAEVDPLAAMDYSKGMGFTGMFVRPALLQGWASVDPENAAQYFKDNPREFQMMGGFGRGRGPMGGEGAAGVIAGEWARNDSDGAMSWALTLEGNDRSSAIASVLREMAATDPAAAAEKAGSLAGEDLGRAYRDIARQWAGQDWQSAQAWVKSLPADEQGDAMSAAIEGLAVTDVQAAARELKAMPADEVDNRAIRTVASTMARDDPAKAAEWLVGLNSEESGGAMREVMVSWAATDSAAALGFIQQQPEGELRDTAAATYVFSNGATDPAGSMKLAETIGDEGTRSRTIGMTARRWMRDDEAAAKAYVESSTLLDDEAKERILSGEGGPGGRGGPGRGRGGR